MRIARRSSIATALIALGVALAGLAAVGVPAQAGTGTGLIGSFGSEGTGPGQFERPEGVAVSSESGDVYVIDEGNSRVEYFNSSGIYLGQFQTPPGGFSPRVGVAVDNSGETALEDPSVGDVYVLDGLQPRVDKFSPTGAYLGSVAEVEGVSFGGVLAMTVGVEGDLWVWEADNLLARCDRAAVNQCETWGHMGYNSPGFGAIAADSENNLYTPTAENEVIAYRAQTQYGVTQARSFSYTEGCRCTSGIAVVPGTNRVYFDQRSAIAEFEALDSSNAALPRSVFGTKALADGGGRGVAAAVSGLLYVADAQADRIDVFGPGPTPEAPLGEAATGVTSSVSVLRGQLNPGAKSTVSWYFAYNRGNSCNGGSTTAVEPEADVQAEQVSAEVGGLEPSTKYTFCLLAENGFGTTSSPPISFKTAGVPPQVLGESANPSEATLRAEVDPENQATTCRFEYGSEATLAGAGSEPCSPEALGEGRTPQQASARLSELQPGVTYYYRVVAENASGERAEGAIQSFTASSVPQAVTGEALEVARSAAALSGSVSTGEGTTTYRFLYVDQAGYEVAQADGAADPYVEGTSSLARTLPAAAGSQAVEPETVQGLLPDTVYHYALQATNVAGTATGADETFKTGAPTPPGVLTGTASGVTFTAATLSAAIQTQGLDVNYAFEISTEPNNYGPPSGAGTISAGSEAATVTMLMQGLKAGTTYYYRALATSTDGTTYGAGGSFTTPALVDTLSLPPVAPLLLSPELAFPTETGTGGNTTTKKLAKKCAKGKQREHGRCVKVAKSKPTRRGRKK